MNIDFEIFEAGPVVQNTDRLHVTINKYGHFFLNRHAHAALGNPDAVTLMCDRRRKIVGLLPTERRHKRAFPLRNKDGQKGRGRVVHANNFCKHNAILPTETLAFLDPQINHNGILVLNLHEVRSVKKT